MIKRYFYDTEGKRIDGKEEFMHDEIAEEIINNNPELLEEYNKIRQAGVISQSVFLVMKGYVYVGGREDKDYIGAMYSSISLNQNTRAIVSDMKESGHYAYDIVNEELTNEQKNEIRSWYKNGMSRSEIINKVMTDMLTLLAPKKNEKIEDEER